MYTTQKNARVVRVKFHTTYVCNFTGPGDTHSRIPPEFIRPIPESLLPPKPEFNRPEIKFPPPPSFV